MNTDGAATVANTSAPVFTSASYNFVAGDVGAWLYISSGTNWRPGWYKIASVASNAATLSAAIGAAVIGYASGIRQLKPSTAVGCATVASPTAATWSIDYSQQSAAQFAYTDLVSAGTGLTVSSAAHPFGKQQVGNSIVVTGGTNFNAGRYVIASVSVVTATVVGPTNITTGAGAAGTGGLGGALASPGQASLSMFSVSNMLACVKTGAYSITSATINVAGGCVSFTSGTQNAMIGYGSVRGDYGTPPLFTASGIATATLMAATGNTNTFQNITVDGASLTAIRGFSLATGTYYKLRAQNCTNSGIFSASAGNVVLIQGVATGCSVAGGGIVAIGLAILCEAFSNTVPGFLGQTNEATWWGCLSYNNTGATADGFLFNANSQEAIGCTAYGNGRDGFRMQNGISTATNCIAEANAGVGFDATGTNSFLFNCGAYNNAGGDFVNSADLSFAFNLVTNTIGTFFVNPGSANFALNNLPGQGALARAAGFQSYPVSSTLGFPDIGSAQHADPPAFSAVVVGSSVGRSATI